MTDAQTAPARKRLAGSRGKLLALPTASLCCNFLYAVYHGALAAQRGSLWFGAMSAFYSILTVARACAVACEGRSRRGNTHTSGLVVKRACGILLVILSAVLAWLNFISLSQNIAVAYGRITMITVATYTFCKAAAAAVKALRQRGMQLPLPAALCGISCAEAAASVLTLQRSMLVSFGTMEEAQIRGMNALTGAGVCLFVLALGMRMIFSAKGSVNDGKVKIGKSK